MAKVTGPLMSMDARGKLANSIVYIGWRGIQDVRRWVKPANPRTTKQVEQRNRFTQAVDKYHELTPTDKQAWETKASGKPYSGFNLFVSRVVKTLVAGKTWQLIKDVKAENITSSSADITGYTDNAELVRVEYGTNPGVYTAYADEPSGRTEAGTFTVSLSGLASGTTYYYRVITQTPDGVWGETGEYSFTTSG